MRARMSQVTRCGDVHEGDASQVTKVTGNNTIQEFTC